MALRKGNVNDAVKKLQTLLKENGFDPGSADGWFGVKTEEAVKRFQESKGLVVDGIVGEKTWAALGQAKPPIVKEAHTSFILVPADLYKTGYDNFSLREDVAAAYQKVLESVHAAGGIIPSSGARRGLRDEVNSARSATSLHYLGRALDLCVDAAMCVPANDPLVVTTDENSGKKLWRVYAKVDDAAGEALTLDAVKYSRGAVTTQKISGSYIDLTKLFANFGFERISARSRWPANYMHAEWWHFQYTRGLAVGKTTFGEELFRVYTRAQLEGTPPWKSKDRVWSGATFK